MTDVRFDLPIRQKLYRVLSQGAAVLQKHAFLRRPGFTGPLMSPSIAEGSWRCWTVDVSIVS